MAIVAGAALTAAPAFAGTITVTTTSDPALVSSDGICSLREAIGEANSNNTAFSNDCVFTGSLGADTITLTSDTYDLDLGALPVSDALTLTRASGLAMIDAQELSRVISHSSGPLTLNRVGVTNGATTSSGAGIQNSSGNLTIADSLISFNEAASSGSVEGGGISMDAGTLDVTRTTFDQNQALSSGGTASGGAIQLQFGAGGFITDSEFSENVASGTAINGTGGANGGAIAGSATSATSTLVISGSSFIDNQASHSNGGVSSFGGGIFWLDSSTPAAELRIDNSTFSGNGADGGSATNVGGAIYAQGSATKIAQVTFGGNTTTAPTGQGDAINFQGGGTSSFQVRGSIFDDSGTDECAGGSLTSVGYNVDQGTTCGLAIGGQDLQNTDAVTQAPAQNGGLTRTRALPAGSPAVDANGGCTSTNGGFVTNDQRGFPRGSSSPEDGTACDSGAYERVTCKGQNVTIFGTDASNTLNGTTGNDVIAGLGGGDTIFGNDGTDTLCGGDGDDTIGGSNGADDLDGGAGPDTVSYIDAGSPGVQVDLAAGTATGSGGTDTLTGFSNVFGSLVTDTIAGDENPNVLEGYADTDTLEGRGGADTLNGTGGIFSSVGDRVVYDEAPSGVTVNLAAAAPQTSGGDGADTLIQIENVTGTPFGDTFKGNGDANVFDGLGGGDHLDYGSLFDGVTVDLAAGTTTGPSSNSDFFTSMENVTGTLGNDTLTGSAGDNAISGLNGEDTITPGLGADTILGGSGEDDIFARDSVADTINCGDDPDTAELDAAAVDSAITDCETLLRPAIVPPDPDPGVNPPTKPKCKKGRKLKKVKGKFKCVKKKRKS